MRPRGDLAAPSIAGPTPTARIAAGVLVAGAVLVAFPSGAAAQTTARTAAGSPAAAPVRGAPSPATPGSQEEAVLEAVQRLFDAMAARDTAAAREALFMNGQLIAVPPGEGAPRVASHREFLESLGAAEEPWHERMWDARVLVEGPIAVVWTPYDLHVGERFSHCGVDALTMIRTEEGWKVAGGIYTLRVEDCPAAPSAPPGSDGR